MGYLFAKQWFKNLVNNMKRSDRSIIFDIMLVPFLENMNKFSPFPYSWPVTSFNTSVVKIRH